MGDGEGDVPFAALGEIGVAEVAVLTGVLAPLDTFPRMHLMLE